MSKTEPRTDVPPNLVKVRIRVERWANTLPEGDDYIVDPAHLVGIDRALDDCIWFMKSRSIPTLCDVERLVPEAAIALERWLIDMTHEKANADGLDCAILQYSFQCSDSDVTFAEAGCRLLEEWLELGKSWDGYLSEARERLGDRLRVTDCPDADELSRHFFVWGEYKANELADSHQSLGRFSTFEPPAPRPRPPMDVYEAVDLARELKKIRDEYEQGQMTADEYRDRSTKLMESYPPGE